MSDYKVTAIGEQFIVTKMIPREGFTVPEAKLVGTFDTREEAETFIAAEATEDCQVAAEVEEG